MIYTTWTTIATLINLTIVLTYEANVSPLDAATVSYSILAVVLLVWWALFTWKILNREVTWKIISEIQKQCVLCFTGLSWKTLSLTNTCGTSSSSTLLWSGRCLETSTKTMMLSHPAAMASSLVRHWGELHINDMWLMYDNFYSQLVNIKSDGFPWTGGSNMRKMLLFYFYCLRKYYKNASENMQHKSLFKSCTN